MAGRKQPHLHADHLLLRPWNLDDVSALVAAYTDPAIQRWHARSMTVAEAGDYVSEVNRSWTQERAASWAVTERGVVLGRMSLRTVDLEEGLAEIGYWVVPAARGRGVAPRALAVVSGWASHELGLHRLELEHSTRNPASCRVAAKVGYILEGSKRSQARHGDGWHDMHLHSLLDEEFPSELITS